MPHHIVKKDFINNLILERASELVEGGILNSDADIRGFAAVGIAFKHEELLTNANAWASLAERLVRWQT